jgi:type II secretory pathway component PulC
MSVSRSKLSRVDHWLVASSALFVVTLLAELVWNHPLELVTQPTAALSAGTADDDPASNIRRRAMDYAAIAQRPLFTLDRRPYQPHVEVPAVESPRAAPPPPRLRFTLSAIVTTPAAEIALLSVNDGPELHKLRQGEGLQGWTLAEVGRDAVVLRNGADVIRVELQPDRDQAREGVTNGSRPSRRQRAESRVHQGG